GLFSLLAKGVNHRCDESGVAFIYGFPNDKSGPGFFKHLDWKDYGYPPFLLHVNNVGYLAKALGGPTWRMPAVIPSLAVRLMNRIRAATGGYHLRGGPDFLNSGAYDELWASFSEDLSNTIVRDTDYLR